MVTRKVSFRLFFFVLHRKRVSLLVQQENVEDEVRHLLKQIDEGKTTEAQAKDIATLKGRKLVEDV